MNGVVPIEIGSDDSITSVSDKNHKNFVLLKIAKIKKWKIAINKIAKIKFLFFLLMIIGKSENSRVIEVVRCMM